jgi:hypothetical protein
MAMQALLDRLARVFRPGRLPPGRDDPAVFRLFLGTRAAFITQKTVLDYCEVKLGRNWQQARTEPRFAEVLEHCRWAVFFPAAGDLTLAAARWLAPHASAHALAIAMAELGEAALREAAQGGPAEAIEAGVAMLRARVLELPDSPALPGPDTMTLAAAQPLLETLPIHPDLRKGERVAILGGLRMNLLAVYQNMERAFDAPALAARLVAPPGPPPPSPPA